MPAFDRDLESLREYYRLEFLPDGFPGRRTNELVEPHPLYGVYVLNDYVKQYRSSPSEDLWRAIERVGDAALDRMQTFHDALVFWYPEKERGVAAERRKHYSGLTQAKYAIALHRAGRVLGRPRFEAAAERVFRSLLIPAELGGVYYEDAYGVSVAEVPNDPNQLILNGWQSALVAINSYAEVAKSKEARSLLKRSVRTLARLLPLYDVLELRNSRYGLVGPQHARFVIDPPSAQVRLQEVELVIPGQRAYQVPATEPSWHRMDNCVRAEDVRTTESGIEPVGATVTLNLVMSRLSYPQENVLRLALDAAEPVNLSLALESGTYDPKAALPQRGEWLRVGTRAVERGSHKLEFALPWEAAELVGYPTNFKKKIDGKFTNIYHVTHFRRLGELHAISGLDKLQQYAKRWRAYICDWRDMDLYHGLFVRKGSDIVRPEAYCD